MIKKVWVILKVDVKAKVLVEIKKVIRVISSNCVRWIEKVRSEEGHVVWPCTVKKGTRIWHFSVSVMKTFKIIA